MGPSLQAKLDLQRAFWRRENSRPVIGYTGSYFSTDTVRLVGRGERPQRHVVPDDIVVDRILEYTEGQFESWRAATGDLFWTATQLYQFRWLAAAVGAKVFVGGDSVWVEPFITDYAELDGLDFRADNPWVQKLWSLTDALVQQSSDRYPVAANEFMSPLSAVVDLRGNTEFAFDLYDRPAEARAGLLTFTELWCKFVRAQYERIPDWYDGYSGAQRLIWAPGQIMEFSEDPSFMLSPAFHRDIVLPSHRKVLACVDYAYIHLHSKQLHTLDQLLALDNLPAIELTPDYGQSVPDLVPVIARIQARKPVIVHAYMTAEEMHTIIEQVPAEGLCVIGRADTPDDARRQIDEVSRWVPW